MLPLGSMSSVGHDLKSILFHIFTEYIKATLNGSKIKPSQDMQTNLNNLIMRSNVKIIYESRWSYDLPHLSNVIVMQQRYDLDNASVDSFVK